MGKNKKSKAAQNSKSGTITPASAPSEPDVEVDAEAQPDVEVDDRPEGNPRQGGDRDQPASESLNAPAHPTGPETVSEPQTATQIPSTSVEREAEAGPSSPIPRLSQSGLREADVQERGDMNGQSNGVREPHGQEEDDRIRQLEEELAVVRGEKETLDGQYRGLLGKLTAMRKSLGEKLREDAEELDRRENTITSLSTQIESLEETVSTLRSELTSASSESASLQSQLSALRSQSDSSSSDVLSLTREMRELRGEMERLRDGRDEWEAEAGRERERREMMEEETRGWERREREMKGEMERAVEEMRGEKVRADNLQDVLAEFQSSKESELRHATTDLEKQLHAAVLSLSDYKSRCADAETRLSSMSGDAGRTVKLEKEIKERERLVSKLRHDAVINNEHLNEALRRLRKSSSESNVDRRLVTNILLAFLGAKRGDTKRFEMLNILATILSWDDVEREKAGLQRVGTGTGGSTRPALGRKGSGNVGKDGREGGRSAEEEAAMNESFSNLFVEFLLKEAGQGQGPSAQAQAQSQSQGQGQGQHRGPSDHPHSSPHSPHSHLPPFSPTGTGANTPAPGGGGYGFGFGRQRTYSQASNSSASVSGQGMMSPPYGAPYGTPYGTYASLQNQAQGSGQGSGTGTMGLPVVGRKESWNLRDALHGHGGSGSGSDRGDKTPGG